MNKSIHNWSERGVLNSFKILEGGFGQKENQMCVLLLSVTETRLHAV